MQAPTAGVKKRRATNAARIDVLLKLFGYRSCWCLAGGRGWCCASSLRDLVIAIFNA